MAAGAWLPRLSAKGEIVNPGDAERGMVNAVAPEAAVAEDLPCLYAGEDVLHTGTDLLMGFVVFLLAVGQVFALASTVGHDEPGARVWFVP